MPRLKRRTATLGEGISTSTGTWRRVTHGMAMLGWCQCCGVLSSLEGASIQDRHEDGKPELLCAEQSVCVGSPFTTGNVVGVAEDNKGPGSLTYC
jgi:hypothetical protein